MPVIVPVFHKHAHEKESKRPQLIRSRQIQELAGVKRALCIGLNYTGTSAELGGCENDAREMQRRLKAAIVREAGILTGECSAAYLFAKLNTLRTIQRRADTFYLTFSGHGTQIPGNEPDGFREGIVLFNAGKFDVVREEDLNTALALIPGSVVVIFDSCFSGGMDREALPPGMRRKSIPFPHGGEVYPAVFSRDAVTPAGKLYYLEACGEDEVSYDLGENGLFTSVLCAAYDKAAPAKRTIKNLIQSTQHAANGWQNPQYRVYGGSAGKKLF